MISSKENSVRILLIGVGYFARRLYVPTFMAHSQELNAELVCGFDLTSQKEVITQYLKSKEYVLPVYFTSDNATTSCLSQGLENHLDMIISKHRINTVIISTEPLSHYKYTQYALSRNLHILLDKPISTHLDVVNSLESATQIFTDYTRLKESYSVQCEKQPNLVFNVMAQRRFHPVFQFAQSMLKEILDLTNCPITSYQLSHSDGRWRFPDEIIEQDYHPYNQGYGKCSHSGYHMFDVFSWLIKSTLSNRLKFDNVELTSQAVYPIDLIHQLPLNVYHQLFPNFADHSNYSTTEYETMTQGFGEVDCFTNGSFGSQGKTTTMWSVNLLHNGSSQRNWVDTFGKDLYKGNGRVKHESHYIVQGPFQSILIEAYQSTEDHNAQDNTFEVGDKNHLDVHVFRNSALFPQFQAHVKYTITEISRKMKTGEVNGLQDESRFNCIREFIDNIYSHTLPHEQTSNILSHELSTNILSMVYQSLVHRKNGISPVIRSQL